MATKFTEVGYVGKDVDSIIRDLADIAVKQTRQAEKAKVQERALEAAEERILDILIPPCIGFCSNGKKIGCHFFGDLSPIFPTILDFEIGRFFVFGRERHGIRRPIIKL
jgi:hypothetical protein